MAGPFVLEHFLVSHPLVIWVWKLCWAWACHDQLVVFCILTVVFFCDSLPKKIFSSCLPNLSVLEMILNSLPLLGAILFVLSDSHMSFPCSALHAGELPRYSPQVLVLCGADITRSLFTASEATCVFFHCWGPSARLCT